MSFINVQFLQDVRKKAHAIQKQNTAPHVLSHGGYEYLEKKLMDEKTKKKLEEAAKFGSTDMIIDHPSPIRRHVKWKMARTKKLARWRLRQQRNNFGTIIMSRWIMI